MSQQTLQASPAAFRQRLLVDTDKGPRRLADVLDPWQREDFETLDPAWRRVIGQDVTPPVQRAWLERPRGHSKTGDVAVMVTWALAFAEKKINGVAVACDRDQSGLLRSSIDTLVRLNPWLDKALDVQQTKIVNPRTGSTLSIESADVASSFGWLVDFAVFDEVSHPAKRDLFDSVFSAVAKRKHALLVTIGNAGFKNTWAWELREKIRTDPAWHFHRLDGPVASWIDESILAEQQRLLPDMAYRRLWLNQWADGTGDAFELGDIDAALNLTGPSPPERGWLYAAGADIGLVHDATCIAVVGRHIGHTEAITTRRARPVGTMAALEDLGLVPAIASESVEYRRVPGTERLKLAHLEIWQPHNGQKVDLQAVEDRIVQLHRQYSFVRVSSDPWQFEGSIQKLGRQGVPVEGLTMSGTTLQALATAMLTEFRGRTIDLINDPILAADLRNLRVASRSYGFRLETPANAKGGTPHGDSVTALALAIRAARHATVVSIVDPNRRLVLN